MNTFFGLVLYVFIGGLLLGAVNNVSTEKCQAYPSTAVQAFVVFGWPMVASYSMVSDGSSSTEEMCEAIQR